MKKLLKTAAAVAYALTPLWVRRIWCKHPEMYMPIVPMMGPAPYKTCPDCGHSEDLTPADYAEGSPLKRRVVGATVIDMTGNLGR